VTVMWRVCYNKSAPAMLITSQGAANLFGRLTMSSIASPRFYVYVLARPDGTPIYVGKGSGDRVHRHEVMARRGVKGHRYNIIRKIWASGGTVQKVIVFTTDDESEAFAYEQQLIAQFGRKTLANRSDGGEGASGHRKSPEVRARLSIIAKARPPRPGTPHTEASRAKMSAVRTGKKLTQEHRANQSAAKRGRTFTAEHRANLSASVKAAANSPEAQARAHAFRHTEESRAKIAESNRRRPISDETREKLRRAALRGAQLRRERNAGN